jgi:transposase-like protein
MSKRDQMKVIREAASDEAKAVELFEAIRWGDSPACPRCGSVNVRKMIGKDGQREKHYRWRCADCIGPRQFSVRTASVLEETRLPLRIWAHAYWRACASKKGVSALQIARECSIRHQSALFLLNRIRHGMTPGANAPKLSGIVEADEAYVGGKPRRPNNAKEIGLHGPGKKAPVLAVVQRGGPVRVRTVPVVTAKNLRTFLLDNVSTDSRLVTDEAKSYGRAGRLFAGGHDTIQHRSYEYARGDVTTNTIEGFFSLLKRKVYGTHHSISKEHLHRYVSEAAFLYNARKLTDDQRVAAAIKSGDGKRLLYREPPCAAA